MANTRSDQDLQANQDKFKILLLRDAALSAGRLAPDVMAADQKLFSDLSLWREAADAARNIAPKQLVLSPALQGKENVERLCAVLNQRFGYPKHNNPGPFICYTSSSGQDMFRVGISKKSLEICMLETATKYLRENISLLLGSVSIPTFHTTRDPNGSLKLTVEGVMVHQNVLALDGPPAKVTKQINEAEIYKYAIDQLAQEVREKSNLNTYTPMQPSANSTMVASEPVMGRLPLRSPQQAKASETFKKTKPQTTKTLSRDSMFGAHRVNAQDLRSVLEKIRDTVNDLPGWQAATNSEPSGVVRLREILGQIDLSKDNTDLQAAYRQLQEAIKGFEPNSHPTAKSFYEAVAGKDVKKIADIQGQISPASSNKNRPS